MIEIQFRYDSFININNIKKLKYKDLLKIECYFCIKVNGRVFFEEPLFPLLEFLYFYKKWSLNRDQDFIYNTIESEDNPLITFKKYKNGWKIDSTWKRFQCNMVFTIEDLIHAVDNLIYTIEMHNNTL